MRTIRELLEVMLNNQQLFITGLCNWCDRLYFKGIITISERDIISNYITKHPTKKYITTSCGYYWEVGNINFRIRWLKKHIELLKQQE